jgi:hypothetical protein
MVYRTCRLPWAILKDLCTLKIIYQHDKSNFFADGSFIPNPNLLQLMHVYILSYIHSYYKFSHERVDISSPMAMFMMFIDKTMNKAIWKQVITEQIFGPDYEQSIAISKVCRCPLFPKNVWLDPNSQHLLSLDYPNWWIESDNSSHIHLSCL